VEVFVPRLYEFDGWSIYMYFKDHAPPHIHLIKNGQEVVYTLTGELLKGSAKGVDERKLKEILERNKDILEFNWNQLQIGGSYEKLR
jgi:intracellular septation protein A